VANKLFLRETENTSIRSVGLLHFLTSIKTVQFVESFDHLFISAEKSKKVQSTCNMSFQAEPTGAKTNKIISGPDPNYLTCTSQCHQFLFTLLNSEPEINQYYRKTKRTTHMYDLYKIIRINQFFF
jgi:hypothetical protein